MATSVPAICSAVAAIASAIAAFIMVRIQRQNMLDSARPELILMGWGRNTKEQGHHRGDAITINKIRNIGKGPALHLTVNAVKIIDDTLIAALSTVAISILPANEEREINSEIMLNWDHAPSHGNDSGRKYIQFQIEMHSACSRGYRHETIYDLFAVEQIQNTALLGGDENEIAPGVMLSARTTTSNHVSGPKMNRILSRLPVIGRHIQGTRWVSVRK